MLHFVDEMLHHVDVMLHFVDATEHHVDVMAHSVDVMLHQVDVTAHPVDGVLHHVDEMGHRFDQMDVRFVLLFPPDPPERSSWADRGNSERPLTGAPACDGAPEGCDGARKGREALWNGGCHLFLARHISLAPSSPDNPPNTGGLGLARVPPLVEGCRDAHDILRLSNCWLVLSCFLTNGVLMSDLPHFFKLKVTKGDEAVEVELGGTKDYVVPGYQDVKQAALALLHRRSGGAQVPPAALLTGPTPQPVLDTPTQTDQVPGTQTSGAPAQTVARPTREKAVRTPTDPAKAEGNKSRRKLVGQIEQAKSFDDMERYITALKTAGAAKNNLDLACLLTRLAQDKFGIDDGLGPSEAQKLLNKRFYIGVQGRAFRMAMEKAPANYFTEMPFEHDARVKLYRPVLGCIEHVKKLLDAAATPQAQTQAEAAS